MSATTGKEYKLAVRIAGIVDKTFNASLVSVKSSLNATLRGLDASFTRLDGGFDKIMAAGRRCFHAIATAAGVAGAAIGAASLAAIKVGMDFEQEMSTVRAISGATGEEMDMLHDRARELGRTSVFSATEVGQAMEYMGMAGWKATEMLDGIEGVLNLAAASGEDLAMVSDIVTDNLTAFHMKAQETTKMVDIMAQAAMNSNTNIEKMGDSFKYVGPVMGSIFAETGTQMEDAAIAIGLMASNGIKASIAGTALRNMVTRMVKPTKESREAIETLGLSLADEEGKMYSFLDVMKQMRDGFAQIADETEKGRLASMLGGQRGMAGLLAIAETTDEEFNKLTDAIYNAEGAAQKMADIKLDNLSGDVQLFKDALADLGIEFTEQNNGPLRSFVQGATKIVNNIAKKLPKAISDFKKKWDENLPKIQSAYKKYAKPVVDFIGNAFKWLISHGQLVISILAGVGSALAAYKVGSSVVHFITSLAGLGGAEIGILAVVGAIGALVAGLTAYSQHVNEIRQQNLDEHFGNIKLSLSEIQQVVDFLTGSSGIIKIKESIEAFSDLDQIGERINESIEKLNKYNWMASIGIELSEDQIEDYKTTIDNYVRDANEYIVQQHYAVKLNLEAGISEDLLESTGLMESIDAFYSDNGEKLESLGKQLTEAINKGFEDNFLDFKEQEAITKIQEKIERVRSGLAINEANKALKILQLDTEQWYGLGTALDPDTFTGILEKASEQVQALNESTREAYVTRQQILDASMQAEIERVKASASSAREAEELISGIREKYAALYEDANDNYLGQLLTNSMKSYGFGISTITNAYSKELDDSIGPMQQEMANWFNTVLNTDWLKENLYLVNGKLTDTAMQELFGNGGMTDTFKTQIQTLLSDEDQLGIRQLLEAMAPQKEELERLAAQYEEAGEDIPESILRGMQTFDLLGALTGDDTSFWNVIANQLVSSPEYEGLLEALRANGVEIPEELSKAIANNKYACEGGILELITFARTFLETAFAQEQVVDVPVRLNFRVSGGGGMPSDVASLISRGYATGGIVSQKQLAWVAEEGPEAIIPLDNSENAIDLWQRAGELLGQPNSLFDTVDFGGKSSDGSSVSVDSTPQFVYSPVQNFYGSTDAEAVHEVNQRDFREFERMMNEYKKRNRRTAFARSHDGGY